MSNQKMRRFVEIRPFLFSCHGNEIAEQVTRRVRVYISVLGLFLQAKQFGVMVKGAMSVIGKTADRFRFAA